MTATLRRNLGLATALAILLLLAGCTGTRLLLANGIARGGDYRLSADLAYGDDPRQRLDIYLPAEQLPAQPSSAQPFPEQPPPPRPTLIFVPGGCWGACDTYPKEDYRFVADAFTAQGYAVVIPDYRLYPAVKFATIIGDVRDAVEWVAHHGAQHGLNTDALVLMGHSAGAQMTALLTLDESHLSADTHARLQGYVGLAGPYDFLPFTKSYQPDLFGPEPLYPASQPVNFVGGDEPPLLLLYGTADTTVKPRNIQSLTRRVQEQGGAVQAHCYDGIDHGSIVGALARPLQNEAPVYADILAFLDQIGRPAAIASTPPLQCTAS